MNNLFDNFPKSTKEEWISLLDKELKGADFVSNLIKKDEIEELEYPSFFHQSDVNEKAQVPGKFPYKRGFSFELNDWSIVGEVLVADEKEANKKALDLLMKGNTALNFEFAKTENVNLDVLFQEIGFEYIKVYFSSSDVGLLKQIAEYFSSKSYLEIFYAFNPLSDSKGLNKEHFISTASKKGISRNFEVDAYSIQQAGANCKQEIAFALALGHEYLVQQINLGRSIDEALLNMHFTFGVGSLYLFEIAKLRAFRELWGKITRSYKPEHACNETVQITSKIGFLNKSLNDPYTNLLRQTTEVMSAVLGGAGNIICQAYDKQSISGTSENAERMAGNISLILKEESYLEKVLDAVGGSYAIESLTESLADASWSLFQQIEAEGGIFSTSLFEQIKETAAKRVALYSEKKKTLIGVNKFPNPDKSALQWKKSDVTQFGLKSLNLEQEVTTLIPG